MHGLTSNVAPWRWSPRMLSRPARYIQPADPVYQVHPARPAWFLLSLGLTLIAAAIWIVLRRRNMRLVQVACGALSAAVLFFCHIFGVVFFAVLFGTFVLFDTSQYQPDLRAREAAEHAKKR